jgi:hypothetical protein
MLVAPRYNELDLQVYDEGQPLSLHVFICWTPPGGKGSKPAINQPSSAQ